MLPIWGIQESMGDLTIATASKANELPFPSRISSQYLLSEGWGLEIVYPTYARLA